MGTLFPLFIHCDGAVESSSHGGFSLCVNSCIEGILLYTFSSGVFQYLLLGVFLQLIYYFDQVVSFELRFHVFLLPLGS